MKIWFWYDFSILQCIKCSPFHEMHDMFCHHKKMLTCTCFVFCRSLSPIAVRPSPVGKRKRKSSFKEFLSDKDVISQPRLSLKHINRLGKWSTGYVKLSFRLSCRSLAPSLRKHKWATREIQSFMCEKVAIYMHTKTCPGFGLVNLLSVHILYQNFDSNIFLRHFTKDISPLYLPL